MLRQLVAGQGCTDDAAPSSSRNPLASLFSHMLGTSKQNEYLHEIRAPNIAFSQADQEKIRNRSHVHTRHLFPGATLQTGQVFVHVHQRLRRNIHISTVPMHIQID